MGDSGAVWEEPGYDLTVGQVVRRERTASYPLPLRAQDRETLFAEWVSRNGEAVRWMESRAVALEGRGMAARPEEPDEAPYDVDPETGEVTSADVALYGEDVEF